MALFHKHHIIPKHVGGSNDESNLISLTIEEHAEAHRILFEQHGRWQDGVAWKSLSNQISCAEATKLAQRLANLGPNNFFFGKFGDKNPMFGKRGVLSPHFGKKHSSETNNKKRLALKNRSYEDLHGYEKSEEIKNKLRKPKTEEHKQKLSKPKPKVVCRICDKLEMPISNYMNWNKKWL